MKSNRRNARVLHLYMHEFTYYNLIYIINTTCTSSKEEIYVLSSRSFPYYYHLLRFFDLVQITSFFFELLM